MQRCSPGKRETNHTRSRLMAQRVKLPTKLLRRELHVAPWELFSEVPHWMSSMMLQMSQKLGLKPICLRKMRLLCHGGLLLGTCPEILIGRCLVKQLQGISHYYLQQGQSKVRFCRANVPEKSRTASTASRYSGCLIIQEKHKDFPKKKWSHNFCPKNCSVIVPSTDDLGLEASCHGAKAFPARAANDCCQLPPHDVPCDTALPKKKRRKTQQLLWAQATYLVRWMCTIHAIYLAGEDWWVYWHCREVATIPPGSTESSISQVDFWIKNPWFCEMSLVSRVFLLCSK